MIASSFVTVTSSSYLRGSLSRAEQVLWLEIAMCDSLLVQIHNRVHNLSNDVNRIAFRIETLTNESKKEKKGD